MSTLKLEKLQSSTFQVVPSGIAWVAIDVAANGRRTEQRIDPVPHIETGIGAKSKIGREPELNPAGDGPSQVSSVPVQRFNRGRRIGLTKRSHKTGCELQIRRHRNLRNSDKARFDFSVVDFSACDDLGEGVQYQLTYSKLPLRGRP